MSEHAATSSASMTTQESRRLYATVAEVAKAGEAARAGLVGPHKVVWSRSRYIKPLERTFRTAAEARAFVGELRSNTEAGPMRELGLQERRSDGTWERRSL